MIDIDTRLNRRLPKLLIPIAMGLMLGLFLNLVNFHEAGLPVLISLFLLLFLAIPAIRRFLKGTFDIFEPIIVVATMFAIGYPLRALSIIWLGDLQLTLRPLGEQETIYYLVLALFYAIIGLVAFYGGYNTGLEKAIGKKLFVAGNQWSAVRTRRITILFSISGLFFYFLLMEMAGGVVHFITHMAYRVELIGGGAGGYVRWGVTLMPLATIIWYIHCLTKKKSKLFWAHFAVSSLLLASLGGRSGVILFWLVLLIIHHYLVKKINLKKMFALVVIFLVFSSGMLAFRLATWGGFQFQEFRMTMAEVISPQELAKSMARDFNIIDRFILIMRGVTVTGELDLKFGRTIFVDPLLMPIPRSVFPDKPTTVGGLIVRTFFPGWGGIGGIPPSLLGEFYLNFLLPGIILGMFLFGMVCKTLYSYLIFNCNNKGVILIYTISITHVLGFALSGNFTLAVMSYLMQIIPLGFAVVYVSGGKILVRR